MLGWEGGSRSALVPLRSAPAHPQAAPPRLAPRPISPLNCPWTVPVANLPALVGTLDPLAGRRCLPLVVLAAPEPFMRWPRVVRSMPQALEGGGLQVKPVASFPWQFGLKSQRVRLRRPASVRPASSRRGLSRLQKVDTPKTAWRTAELSMSTWGVK